MKTQRGATTFEHIVPAFVFAPGDSQRMGRCALKLLSQLAQKGEMLVIVTKWRREDKEKERQSESSQKTTKKWASLPPSLSLSTLGLSLSPGRGPEEFSGGLGKYNI